MVHAGLGRATLVYSSLGWGRGLLSEAKLRGIPVVTEFYVRPTLWNTYQNEYRAFPEWEPELPFSGLENGIGTIRDPCMVSDFVIAPSEVVADEVTAVHSFARQRIAVVPYGIDDRLFGLHNRPIMGRVLFAGTCCLGKGIHYLAFAAEELASRGIRYEFRVAGHVGSHVRTQTACKYLNFLGRIPRSEFLREYEAADVVVIPSLSEGCSTVGLEALAAGVPVVATTAAGTVVRNGIDGLIVPERDSKALAEAIAQIVEDRALRERMAAAARIRAQDYTWKRYGDRLIAALRRFGRL
jgi:glycosyltransferase involved in cell wall biosynthesis